MTARDLRTMLASAVASEPPFTSTATGVVAAGRRAVRRRRIRLSTVAGVASLAILAGISSIGLHTRTDSGEADSPIPPAARQVLDGFDRATFPLSLDTEVRRAVGASLPAGAVGRIEPTLDGYNRLRPEDYAYTDSWTAWYDVTHDDQLMVILRHDQSANEGSARRYCSENLRIGEMERCSVAELADGSIAIASVSELNRTRRGFSRSTGDPDSRWFMRQVVNRRAYGFGVIAREYVKASTLADADSRWSFSVAQLTAIAGSPRLVYRMPDEPKRNCDPTFLMPKTESGYAQVVCEESLNH